MNNEQACFSKQQIALPSIFLRLMVSIGVGAVGNMLVGGMVKNGKELHYIGSLDAISVRVPAVASQCFFTIYFSVCWCVGCNGKD